MLRACYTALAPPAEDNFDIVSMALASETPLKHREALLAMPT
jgi:hypothetical protein